MVMRRKWLVKVHVDGVYLGKDSFDTEGEANKFADDAIRVFTDHGKRDVEVQIFDGEQLWSSYNTANNA